MKILFIGSIPGHVPGANQPLLDEHRGLMDAAEELGYQAASRGHRILIGSVSERTIDRRVLDGAIKFCSQEPSSTVHIEVHRPDSEAMFSFETPKNLHIVPFFHHSDDSSPHKWIVAHMRAADEADAIISIAGGVSTRLIGHLAADRGKTILPVACFGGASMEIFNAVRYRLSELFSDNRQIETVLRSWAPQSAQTIIEAAEAASESTQRPHRYFLSYSWVDCSQADHVELVLRRSHRVVVRDEMSLAIGEKISSRVEALIEECDTFLAIWSDASSKSDWCPYELSFAQKLKAKGSNPRRIVFLRIDETDLPLKASGELWVDGSHRAPRQASLDRLMNEEDRSNFTD